MYIYIHIYIHIYIYIYIYIYIFVYYLLYLESLKRLPYVQSMRLPSRLPMHVVYRKPPHSEHKRDEVRCCERFFQLKGSEGGGPEI